MKTIAGSLLLLAIAAAAHAQSADILSNIRYGNGLYQALKECETQKTTIESMDCFAAYGYIGGVRDNDANIVVPADARWEQAFDIVRDFLEHHPEKRQRASVVLIRTAFKEVGWWKD